MKLSISKEGNEKESNILIAKDSFEHILNCLDNLKFVYDLNADALTGDYEQRIAETWQAINECVDQINVFIPEDGPESFIVDYIDESEMKLVDGDICLSMRIVRSLSKCFEIQKMVVELNRKIISEGGEIVNQLRQQVQIDTFNRKCRNFWCSINY